MSFSTGSRVWSVEFTWGEVVDVNHNGNIGVRFMNTSFDLNDTPSFIEWYNSKGERLAKIRTNKTLFSYPQEIIPISMGSIV